jgi:2-haloacid dehalogenase
MANRPQAIAFDVLETLFDSLPVEKALAGAGLPAGSGELWLARTLRNGFALAASGAFHCFDEVARATLRGMLEERELEEEEGQVDAILGCLRDLPPHSDVGPALSRVRAAGVPAVAVSNAGTDAIRELLGKAGLAAMVEGIVSIDDVQHWKPRPEVYWHVARLLGLATSKVAVVAAHGWDVHGAHRAGFTTGFVARHEARVDVFDAPDVHGDDLVEVCERLLALPS